MGWFRLASPEPGIRPTTRDATLARFLALDWDQNQLHVLSAELHRGTVRVKRAMVWHEPQIPNPAQAEDLGKLLRDRLKEANIAPAPVLACVGRDRLIVKDIRFPSVPAPEEPAVVRFQTVKELTDAAEDVVIDYVVTGGTPGGEQKASSLVIRKELLDTYREICEAAGLKLIGLSPRVFGVASCLRKVMGTTVITPQPEPAEGVIAIVNIGEKLAEISILKGSSFLLMRSLPNGPGLLGEIRRNLAVHAGQMPHLPVVAVYLTGQGCGELRQKLSETISQPVYTFDPFAWTESVDVTEVGGPGRAREGGGDLFQEADSPRPSVATRGTFSGAMGLLFLKAASDELPINFVTPRQPKPPANPNYRLIRLGLVAGIALFMGMIVLGRVLHASWSEELARIEGDREQIEKQLAQTRENGKRLKMIDDWDHVVWLDELYDLTARIPDVNALRVTEIQAEPLPRNDKSKAVAKATIKGKLLGKSNPRQALDELVTRFRQDGYYSVSPPSVEKDKFSLVVQIERRGPDKYTQAVKVEKLAPQAATKTPEKSAPEKAIVKGEDAEQEEGNPAAKRAEKGEEKATRPTKGKMKGKRRSDD